MKSKQVSFTLSEEQHKKLKLYSFYSGKTIGELLRLAIDKLNPEEIHDNK